MSNGSSGRPRGNEAVFVGIGELVSGRFPDRTFMGDIIDVSVATLKNAGLTPRDVDVILFGSNLHSMDAQADLIFSRVAEELGVLGGLKTNILIHSGGSTSDNLARIASSLIRSGEALTVLVAQAERWGSAPVESMIDMLTANGIPREWERPVGLSFNSIGALLMQRYMHESGSTAADLASICVALREWAHLNPNAMFRDKKLAVEDVLKSRLVSDPLHALECPMMADGGVGFVMTTAEHARKLGRPAVKIVGSGGSVTHFSLGQETNLGTLGWPKAAHDAFAEAGWGPKDAQFAQVYDSYPSVLAVGLEGIGVAAKGEAARMFAAGAFSPGGRFPVNTNGGLLSGGHIGIGGGLALLVEGVRQLLWAAPASRQIKDCRRGIVGGTGGSYSDAQVLLMERVD
jgi:acetyl-CoA C-acetyltransferase